MKTKQYTIEQLNKLVIAEAKNLKKFATKEEIDRLDFETLDANNSTSCIYGQMTGSCFTGMAIGLIELSCKKVFACNKSGEIDGDLNGSPIGIDRDTYWSPIEVFIYKENNKKNGNNKRLISFIKGKTDTLILK